MVLSAKSIAPDIETIAGPVSRLYRDITRQIVVQSSNQRRSTQCRFRPETYHLSLGMHTGIGSTSCHDPAAWHSQSPYGLLKLALNGRQAKLPLKAIVLGTVILDEQDELT